MLGTVTGKVVLHLTGHKGYHDILEGIQKTISDDLQETGELKQLILWAIDHYLKKDHDSQTDDFAFFFGEKKIIKTWTERTSIKTVLLKRLLGDEGRKTIEVKRLKKVDDQMELIIDLTVVLGEVEKTTTVLQHIRDIPSVRIQDAHLLNIARSSGD